MEPLPLRPFIDQVIKKPIPDGIWVLTMLCSTLVPTAIHAMILLASPVTVWLRSDSRREDIADGLVATPPRDGAIREASRHLMEARLIGFIAFAAFMIIFLTAIRALLGPVSIIIVKLADCGMAAASKVAVAFGWT